MEVQTDAVPEAKVVQATTETVEKTTEGQVPEGQQPEIKASPEENDLVWTDEQKDYISKLRGENAKYRTRSKDLESKVTETSERLTKFETGLKTLFGDENTTLTPEEQIETLQTQNEQLQMQTALRDAAYEYNVGREGYEYFEFLVSKKLGELGEGEEMSEDTLEEIAKMANSKNANSSTSVDGSGNPTPKAADGSVTLDEFRAMGIMERSVFYGKNKELYNALKTQEDSAKKKR